jgi:hypothetical protein
MNHSAGDGVSLSMKMRCTLAMALFLLAGPVAIAQPQDLSIKFRLAQSYEQGGNFENAAKLYQELPRRIPATSSTSTDCGACTSSSRSMTRPSH